MVERQDPDDLVRELFSTEEAKESFDEEPQVIPVITGGGDDLAADVPTYRLSDLVRKYRL